MKEMYKTTCECGACGKLFDIKSPMKYEIGKEVLHHECEGSERLSSNGEMILGHVGIARVIKSSPVQYGATYKCRSCGQEFSGDAFEEDGTRYPTAPIYIQHECKLGYYGVADLIGTYEVD